MQYGVVNSEHEAIANGKNNNLNEPQKRQEQQTQAIIELTAKTRNTTTNNNNPLHTSLREYHENLYSSKSEPENLTRFYHQIHLTTPPNREDE